MTASDASKIGPAVRTIVSILIVSVLIWLFAEAQSVSESDVDVRLSVHSPAGSGLFVSVDDPAWTGRASVRLQGARAALDEASRQLADGVPLFVGGAGIAAEPGRQIVDLRSTLMANPPLDRADVTIASVEPRTLELRIDELTRVPNVSVRVDLPGVQTVGDIQVEPPTVALVIPNRVREAFGARLNSLAVVATLPPSVLRAIPEGGPHKFDARLVLPDVLEGEPAARIEPQSVSITFRVQSTTESLTIPSVPVWPMAPPTEINRWSIEVDPILLREVQLSGPSDVIQRIRSGDLRVIATVQLSSDELEQGITSKAPIIVGLPDSVRVESRLEPVRLTITPRAPEASAEEPPTQD